jgi:hypothetical protein
MLAVWKPHADLDCRLDLVEERLDQAVVARLDPLAPDVFVLFERLTVDRVAEECPAIGRFDLEVARSVSWGAPRRHTAPRRLAECPRMQDQMPL